MNDLEAARQAFLRESGDDNVVTLGAIPEFPVDAIGGSLRDLIEWGIRDGQQAPMLAWAGLGALAASIPKASLRLGQGLIRPSLWMVIVGPVSVGKTAALKAAFGILQGLDPPVLVTDSTIEALQDQMAGGMSCYYADELTGFCSNMGRYGNGDAKTRDESFFREVWSGVPISRARKTGNFYLPDPVLSVCGGLQPSMLHKLGSPREGQLARWLPCHPEFTKLRRSWHPQPLPPTWTATLESLYFCRSQPREWTLNPEAVDVMAEASERWASQYRNAILPEHVLGALSKAEDQAMRLILILAESWQPAGAGGQVPAPVVRAAASLVDYAMASWEALDSPGLPATLTAGGRSMAESSRQFAEILQSREPAGNGVREMDRREMQTRKVCSMRTARDIDMLIKAYGEEHPGRVITRRPASGHGPDQIVCLEPERREKQS